jgi:hypothetical protein
MKKILYYALMISMLATASCSKDEEDNSVIPIPDPVFKAYLLDNFDYNHNGEISFSEAKNVKWMSCRIPGSTTNPYAGIASFSGIEYFTELEALSFYNSPVKSLDLSKNTKLTSLIFDETEISSLDLSHNVNLIELACSYSKLTSLDISNNVNLKELYCMANDITELDVSKNILLEEINCNFCKLTVLDLRYNVNLRDVSCIMDTLIKLILIEGHQYNVIYTTPYVVNIIYV